MNDYTRLDRFSVGSNVWIWVPEEVLSLSHKGLNGCKAEVESWRGTQRCARILEGDQAGSVVIEREGIFFLLYDEYVVRSVLES